MSSRSRRGTAYRRLETDQPPGRKRWSRAHHGEGHRTLPERERPKMPRDCCEAAAARVINRDAHSSLPVVEKCPSVRSPASS